MILYGVAGTNGSGKDTFGELLVEKDNFLFVSVTDMLREEARLRGWPLEREKLRTISAEWRREHGLGVLVDKAFAHFEELGGDEKYAGLVMASMRNPGEADRIHELGGKMVWIDADPKIRYYRIHSRQRTVEDDKTFEQFLSEEQAEMTASGDETTLDGSKVKEQCDIFITNDSHETKDFYTEIRKSLEL
ncbi:MAG: AAA family ATPase [bacterium]|nr:AAA family ATPase [bacterium]